jgi:hypothetical protein
MGLDMYLYKTKHFSSLHKETDENGRPKYRRFKSGSVIIKRTTEDGKEIEEVMQIENPDESLTIKQTVLYWRKANAIHKWFVDNVQDGNDNCGEYSVYLDQLKDLLELCKKVKDNPNEAPQLLPTTDGFFFGSTEYDEMYMDDIKYTIKRLEEIIKTRENEQDGWFTYSSSW